MNPIGILCGRSLIRPSRRPRRDPKPLSQPTMAATVLLLVLVGSVSAGWSSPVLAQQSRRQKAPPSKTGARPSSPTADVGKSSSASLRRDYRELAKRLSMNITLELRELDAKLAVSKLKEYSELGALSRSSNPTIREVAESTAKVYASLETVRLIHRPDLTNPESMFLSIFTMGAAQEQLARDEQRLYQHQRQVWPRVLTVGEQIAGPDAGAAETLSFRLVLLSDEVFGVKHVRRAFEFRNTSGAELTNCTISAEFGDMWGKSQTHYFFLEKWPAGEPFRVGFMTGRALATTARFSLLSDQVRKNPGLQILHDFDDQQKSVRDFWLRFLDPQKVFTGTSLAASKRAERKQVSLQIKKIDFDTPVFKSPQIDAVIWDPTSRNLTTVPLQGRLLPIMSSDEKRMTGMELRFEGGFRSYAFTLQRDSLVGEDSSKTQYVLR